MLKKPQVLGILFAIIVFALVSVTIGSNDKAGILSKESHAEKLWKTSGHAHSGAEAFIHWDEDGEIPTGCAKCHSTPGFQDFIADGTVDSAAPTGTTVECEVCHTNRERGILRDHTSVMFPSGLKAKNLGPEALCMECHQGRASKKSVDDAITSSGVADDDTISTKLRFINIHYYAAAADQFGTVTKGGYEYQGKSYDARFSHVTGYNACNTCHNPHSLEVELNACNTCHTWTMPSENLSFFGGIKDPKDIRFFGSFVDYDGDGDITEGIFYEIEAIKEKLYAAIQAYGTQIGSPIVYEAHTHPYFFYDTNGNGVADSSEVNSGNSYLSFTPRLLRAAYNYQVSQKDPNAFAHGGKYVIQLLYDSIEDLNTTFTSPISMAGMSRVDEGHFDGSAEAWRHWDEDGEVSSSCAKCHSAEGLPYFLENGENVAAEISNGMLCTTCHTSPPQVRTVSSVTFPSGVIKDLGNSSNICINCHQGRESKLSVDSKIVASSGPYTFTNIHYFAVGAVLYGSEVHGGYEFEGKTYTGQRIWPNHNGRFDTCVECHMGTNSPRKDTTMGDRSDRSDLSNTTDFSDHNVHKPNQEDCVFCHGQDVSQPNPGADPSKFKFSGIRPYTTPDYDADGNTTEALEFEIRGLEEALIAQIMTYATNVMGAPIVYADSYPYFFNDLNGNGVLDPDEDSRSNSYLFDAALLKAAYNYQFSLKEPHGYIHNSRYVAQLLVDSIEHLGGDISGYTWR